MNTTTLKDSIYYLTSGFDNLNIRSNYIVQSLAEANTKIDWQRTISIAMPFFSLHSKAAPVVSHLARGYQLYSIWMEDSKGNYNKPLQTALLAGSIALDHIFPSAQLLYSSLVLFIDHAQKFQKGGNWDKAESLYQITSQIIHLASIYYGTPKWVVLSLLSQGVGELKKAYKEERKPEAIANVLLAAIRGYKAGSYVYNDFSLARAKQVQPKPVSPEVQPEPISPEESDVADDDYNFPEDELDFVDSNPPAETLTAIKYDEADFSAYEFEDHDCSDDSEFPQTDIELHLPNSEAINPPAEKPAFKNLTTSDWNMLYQKHLANRSENKSVKLHLYTLLKTEGFSHILNDIDFSQTAAQEWLSFEHLQCNNCNFSNMKFYACDFYQFTAVNCNFSKTTLHSVSIAYSTFKSCDLTSMQEVGGLSTYETTLEECLGNWPHGKHKTDVKEEIEELDESDRIEPAFKNPSSPFTDFDHELNGDLEAKIDAKHYTMVDANNNEYNFGSYFHGFGQYLVKGANLNFRKVVYKNGSKGIELSFKVNHIFHKRLRKIIGAMKEMSPEEQLEFAQEFQARGMKLDSKAAYILGQQRIESDSAYKVTFDGVGSLMVGRKSYYSLKDQVKVTLKDGATLESFHHFLAIFGLQDALKKSSEEDLEKLKLGILFRTYFPMKAHYLEKNGDTFHLTLDQLKQKFIDEVPKMKKIMGKYAVQKIELFPGYFKYGVPLDKKAYSMGARALTTALTSLSDEMKEADLDQVANILKNGLLSQEMREKNGISSSGLNEKEEYEDGGSQSIYSQMITTTDLTKQKSMKDFGYSSPVRLFISLEALNQGSYQYYYDEFGIKDSDIYLTRPTIPEFIKRDLSNLESHEIMSPDRVLPGYIKAMSVKTEEIKQQIIAHLRKCNIIHDEQINGIPVNEFIRTEHHITPDLVKHCAPKPAG